MSPLLESFVGGTYKTLSPTTAADVAINVFAVTRRVEGSEKKRWLFGTPGRRFILEAAGAACRGWFSHNDRHFVTLGGNLYEFTPVTLALTLIGAITDNGEPVSYASNGQGGNQIAIVGGNELKIYTTTTNVLSAAIVLPFTGPVMVAYLDGYFLINQRTSPIIWFSALEDGTSWDALDFIARSGTSDDVIGLRCTQDRVWVFGSKTTTLFYDSGDADTPFLPYPGTAAQVGAITPWAISQRKDIFTWLAHETSQESEGAPCVVKATGSPASLTISTPPIDRWLASCSTLRSAEMLTYQQDGHTFVALSCPNSPDDVQTYVWDDTEQLWHARAGWNAATGRFTRWRARGVAHISGQVYVGDIENGRLFTLDLTTYTDDSQPLRRVRRMPFVSNDSGLWLFISQIELVCQVGIGLSTGQGSQPVVDLRISRDAAQTWVSAGTAILGAIGAYATRTIWRRLGRVRADRLVIEIAQSDPVVTAWLGLSLRSEQGTGQA